MAESVAEGIKRRAREQKEAGRRRMRLSVNIALWSGVLGFAVMTMAIAGTSWPRAR